MTAASLLVIGSQGQVAQALQRLAPQRLPGQPLIAVGRPELDLAAATATLEPQIEALLRSHRPALVINAAAYTDVDKAESEPEAGRGHQRHRRGAAGPQLCRPGHPARAPLHRLRVRRKRQRPLAGG
ncbi:sugar nucleotide-binding protein [Synechococcus sp. GFB01]|uniref:sugar nucleotide-binding protein n=1 Tax=Synechococcus sp. GFB01 TaxID=1662190 RepID=UPI000AA25160|nr:sugar nucleotide-binding protein [Synechococcus sp. GFB01]